VVPAVSSVTFAPNVGIIALVSGNGERFVLQSAVVGSKRYPQAGVTSKLVFDQASYVNRSNTIQCITTPCPGNGVNAVAKYTYTISNHSGDTRTWQFSTGCQHDLTLTDAGGKVVKQLSDGRYCTQALTHITLAPGQTKTITGSITLTDSNEQQLSGTFTAKAYLAPRSGVVFTPVAEASATIAVSIKPAL
jgi:hypothetical protein